MRFCRFQRQDRSTEFGLFIDDQLVSLQPLAAVGASEATPWVTFEQVLRSSPDELRTLPPVTEPVRLLSPVARPDKILCVGLNYRDHAIETGSEIPTEPIIFSKFTEALIGPEDPIILPAVSQRVDYEAELVAVIGKTCRQVDEAHAMDYVFGYCCGHDVSARDWQKGRPGGQWLLGKTFDTFAPLGPYLVHHSAVPNVDQLRVQMRLNGETLQDSTTAQLIFSIPQVIAYVSRVTTLRPGDLIYTGTPPGVGDARTPPRYLSPGDVCEVEVEGLGTLRNPCVAAESPEAEAFRAASDAA